MYRFCRMEYLKKRKEFENKINDIYTNCELLETTCQKELKRRNGKKTDKRKEKKMNIYILLSLNYYLN
jgi:hypothetical protein